MKKLVFLIMLLLLACVVSAELVQIKTDVEVTFDSNNQSFTVETAGDDKHFECGTNAKHEEWEVVFYQEKENLCSGYITTGGASANFTRTVDKLITNLANKCGATVDSVKDLRNFSQSYADCSRAYGIVVESKAQCEEEKQHLRGRADNLTIESNNLRSRITSLEYEKMGMISKEQCEQEKPPIVWYVIGALIAGAGAYYLIGEQKKKIGRPTRNDDFFGERQAPQMSASDIQGIFQKGGGVGK